MRWMISGMIVAAALAGCSQAPREQAAPEAGQAAAPTEASPTPIAVAARDLTGRWIGVEGMYLVVSPGPGNGRYALEMQWDLDHKATLTGRTSGDGIAFERDGKRETLRPTDGDATGLKYLAGKKDCLTVKSGEGYCQD